MAQDGAHGRIYLPVAGRCRGIRIEFDGSLINGALIYRRQRRHLKMIKQRREKSLGAARPHVVERGAGEVGSALGAEHSTLNLVLDHPHHLPGGGPVRCARALVDGYPEMCPADAPVVRLAGARRNELEGHPANSIVTMMTEASGYRWPDNLVKANRG
jgi:hypothetical protein